MKAERIALMPHWPARLGEDLAAAYLSVSRTTFRERVAHRTYPQPIHEGRLLLWSRRQLAEQGLSDAEIGAMTPDTVRHYTKQARASMIARGTAERATRGDVLQLSGGRPLKGEQ